MFHKSCQYIGFGLKCAKEKPNVRYELISSFQHVHSLHCALISNSKKKLVVSKELTEERHSVALMLHVRNIYPHVTLSLCPKCRLQHSVPGAFG